MSIKMDEILSRVTDKDIILEDNSFSYLRSKGLDAIEFLGPDLPELKDKFLECYPNMEKEVNIAIYQLEKYGKILLRRN